MIANGNLPGRSTATRGKRCSRMRARVIAEDQSHSSVEKRHYCFGVVGEGVMTVRFTYRDDVIRILGAGYWRKGKRIYERENQIHE